MGTARLDEGVSMRKYLACIVLLVSSALTGCTSVAVQDASSESYAKEFNPPPAGWSGLYLYRTCNVIGAGFDKGLYVDGQYIGDSTRCSFFYRLVEPGTHTIQTASEFGENEVSLEFKEGSNHFVKQYLRPGLVLFGAELEIMEPDEIEEAKEDIKEYSLNANQDNPELNLDIWEDKPGKGSVSAPGNKDEAKSMAK
jgi:hypothetical protein